MAIVARAAKRRDTPDHRTSGWSYGLGFVRHPIRTWTDLLADPKRLRFGFFAVLLVGIGYAFTEAGIAFSGGMPSTPWLAIPPTDYFKWEALFSAPVTVLCWVLAAGVMHLLSKPFRGQGSFDDTAALAGFAIAFATLISLIPDAIRALLTVSGVLNRAAWEEAVSTPGTPDFFFLWASMLGYVLALLCLLPVAIGVAERLGRRQALLVGMIGAAVYQGVYIIFIR